jgi:uncharacterized damage-inducible protein DinB
MGTTEVQRILDQLKRAYDGEAWHGPSLREVLVDVTAEQAAARPLPNAHTIWELVLHITAWENAARNALAGEPLHVSEAENFPAIADTSEAAWRDALAALEAGHHALRDALARLTDADLDTVALGRTYSVYFLLHGVVQHDLYHAGQIVLLKKALITP